MVYCSIVGCNRYRKEIGIGNKNQFLVTKQRVSIWKNVLEPHGTILSVGDYVCNIHFKDEEYKLPKSSKVHLQDNAIPSRFLKIPLTTEAREELQEIQSRERPLEDASDSTEILLDKRQKIDDSGSSVSQVSNFSSQLTDGIQDIVNGIQDELAAVKTEIRNRIIALNEWSHYRIRDLESKLLSYQQSNVQKIPSKSTVCNSPKLVDIPQSVHEAGNETKQSEVAETSNGASTVGDISKPLELSSAFGSQSVKKTTTAKKTTNHEKRSSTKKNKSTVCDSPKLVDIPQSVHEAGNETKQSEVAETSNGASTVGDISNPEPSNAFGSQNVQKTPAAKKTTNREKGSSTKRPGRQRKIVQELVDQSASSNLMDSYHVLVTSTSSNSVENENDWQKIINGEYSYKDWKSFVDSTKTSITFYEPVFVDGNINIIKQVTITRQKIEKKMLHFGLHGQNVENPTWKNLNDVETILKQFDEIDEQKYLH